MAAAQLRKRSSDSVSEENIHSPPPEPFNLVIQSIGLKPAGNMLMGSIMSLNRAFGKLLLTGLKLDEAGLFYPVVFLGDNKFNGLIFTADVWENFTREIPAISNYFENDGNSQRARHNCEGFSYSFATVYKNRTVILHPGYQAVSGQIQPSTPEDAGPSTKRPRTYDPAIYLQAATFKKLVDGVNVVNRRLKNLEAMAPLAQDCKKLIVSVLKSHIPSIEQLMGKNALHTGGGRTILEKVMKKKTDNGESILYGVIHENIPADAYTYDIDLLLTELINIFEDEIIDEALKP